MSKALIKKQNTFLFRLIMTTVVVVLCTVTAVGLLSYANIETEVRRNEEIYYQQRFQYDYDLMEQQIIAPLYRAYRETIIMDSWTKTMRQLTESTCSQNYIVAMKKLLEEKIATTDCLVDAAVYCPNGRYVISGLSGVNFLETNGTGATFDVDWINYLDNVNNAERLKWLRSRPFPINLGVRGDVFSLVCYYSINTRVNKVIYLCYSVPCERFTKLLTDQENGTIFMVDAEGGSVLGTGSLPQEVDVGSGRAETGEAVYFMKKSDYAPWYYVMAVSNDIYSQYSTTLRSRFWVVSILIFCVMVIGGLWAINRLTSPFTAMLEKARSLRSQQYTYRRNDLLFVADTFNEVVNNAEEAQKQLDERLDSLKNSFLLMLLHGRHMKNAEITSYMRFLRLDMVKSRFIAVILQNQRADFDLCDERFISETLQKFEDDDVRLVGAGIYGRLYYFIVNCDDVEIGLNRVTGVTGAIREVDYLNEVVCRTGGAVDHLTDIGQSYCEAEEKMERREESGILCEDNNEEENERENAMNRGAVTAEEAAVYLQCHFAEDISIQNVADDLQMSRSHLSRVFKETHGMTILEYLMGLRLSKAMELLNTTSLSVNEISEQIGFNNSNYFYRKFKEKFGCTPMQYRQGDK